MAEQEPAPAEEFTAVEWDIIVHSLRKDAEHLARKASRRSPGQARDVMEAASERRYALARQAVGHAALARSIRRGSL